MNTLSAELADAAESLSGWFVHDPDPWNGHDIPHGELRRLASCIHRRREAEVALAGAHSAAVRPLGLVLKAGSWYLVSAAIEYGAPEVICIDHLRALRVTRRRFERPSDFELGRFWKQHLETM